MDLWRKKLSSTIPKLHYSIIPAFLTVGTFKILETLNSKIFLAKDSLKLQHHKDIKN